MVVGSRLKSVDSTVRPGVLLFLGGVDDCADRVQLSSGTMAAPSTVSGGSYEEGAVIPRPGWRNLRKTEQKILLAESCPEHYGNAISIIRLPSPLLDPWWAVHVAGFEYQSSENFFPITGSKKCSSETSAIISYLQQRFQLPKIDERQVLDGGICTKTPGLETVTTDPDTHGFIGLHVDSWYWRDFELSRREHAPNRICVNLGLGDRFFLYMNVPIGDMFELVKNADSLPVRSYGPSEVAKDFMKSFPSYPVVRVRVRPGEAYVAPTENITHDASSIDTKVTDIALSIRGRFGLCPM
jgi:hypothetical protein